MGPLAGAGDFFLCERWEAMVASRRGVKRPGTTCLAGGPRKCGIVDLGLVNCAAGVWVFLARAAAAAEGGAVRTGRSS